MKLRHVFSTRDAAHALVAVRLLDAQGIGGDAVSLVARDDIELDQVPNRMKEADTDMMPAAARGMAIGGATGVLAGLAAMVVPPLGITLAGAAAMGAAGALVGGWSSALMGSAIADPVRQRFESEIAAGHVLVLVDADEATQARLEPLLVAAGVQKMDYETPSALA